MQRISPRLSRRSEVAFGQLAIMSVTDDQTFRDDDTARTAGRGAMGAPYIQAPDRQRWRITVGRAFCTAAGTSDLAHAKSIEDSDTHRHIPLAGGHLGHASTCRVCQSSVYNVGETP